MLLRACGPCCPCGMRLSDRRRLKCIWGGEEEIVDIAYELGLGIASTLKPGDKEPLGPVLDTEALFKNLLNAEEVQWPAVLRRFLGFRLCTEDPLVLSREWGNASP
ncbi:hypothetical protein AK812_SmicGene18683 [Symbiodinium microadriaticum]|uniref:Uncharacterized protein n=1 Tax=Symbiodinium microadriaticum TaxID=2951 RepID=A0A1Q9DUH7_SYMMI|nr:hypothetical protein AK812_SmicGene18683 [Symbiodinium microadriaticum]